jgi:hypothetical protein
LPHGGPQTAGKHTDNGSNATARIWSPGSSPDVDVEHAVPPRGLAPQPARFAPSSPVFGAVVCEQMTGIAPVSSAPR